MEKLLKVLLSVDGNNYKITIKTKNFTNAVPFSEFKYFLDDKQKQLFNDIQYIWKIYDNDFGEYVSLDENSLIYNLSKLKAIKVSNDRPSAPLPQVRNEVVPMQIDDEQSLPAVDRSRALYGQTNFGAGDARTIAAAALIAGPPLRDAYSSAASADHLDLRKFVTASAQDRQALYSQQRQLTQPCYDRGPAGDPYSRLSDPLTRSDPYARADARRDAYADPYARDQYGGSRNSDPYPMILPLSGRTSSYGAGNTGYTSSSLNPPSPLYDPRISADYYNNYNSNNNLNSLNRAAYETPSLLYSTSAASSALRGSAYGRSSSYLGGGGGGFSSYSSNNDSSRITKRATGGIAGNNRNRVLSSLRSNRTRSPERRARSPQRRPGDVKILQRAIHDLKSPARKKPSAPTPTTGVSAATAGFRFFLKLENIPQKRDLVRAVQKYNEEFVDIAVLENVWETNRIWNYVAKEIGSKKQVILLRDCRKMFKDLVDQYKKILNNPKEWSKCGTDVWPFFHSFHEKLDLKPFDEKIEKLKDSFDEETRKINGIKTPPKKKEPEKPVSTPAKKSSGTGTDSAKSVKTTSSSSTQSKSCGTSTSTSTSTTTNGVAKAKPVKKTTVEEVKVVKEMMTQTDDAPAELEEEEETRQEDDESNDVTVLSQLNLEENDDEVEMKATATEVDNILEEIANED